MDTDSVGCISSVSLLPWDKLHRHPVDAVAQPRRLGAVLEEVPLMAFAAGAVDFGPWENQFVIGRGLDDFRRDRLPEAGPASAAVELMLG